MIGVTGLVPTEVEQLRQALSRQGSPAVITSGPPTRGRYLTGLVVAGGPSEGGWSTVIETAVTTVWLEIRRQVPQFVTAAAGAIVLCAPSPELDASFERAVAIAAARRSVIGLGRCLANELGPLGIRVNTVDRVPTPWVPGTAETVAWLLSARAKRLTGAVLPGSPGA